MSKKGKNNKVKEGAIMVGSGIVSHGLKHVVDEAKSAAYDTPVAPHDCLGGTLESMAVGYAAKAIVNDAINNTEKFVKTVVAAPAEAALVAASIVAPIKIPVVGLGVSIICVKQAQRLMNWARE